MTGVTPAATPTNSGTPSSTQSDPQLEAMQQQMEQMQINNDAFQVFAQGVQTHIGAADAVTSTNNTAASGIRDAGRA